MLKRTQKSIDKRKEERACLPEFFKRHINIIKTQNKHCEECGLKLKGCVSEVAHILPKQKYKSIMCNDLNVLYLCGMYSNSQCHSNFDNFPQEKVKKMLCIQKVYTIFTELEKEITEKIDYKTYDRYSE